MLVNGAPGVDGTPWFHITFRVSWERGVGGITHLEAYFAMTFHPKSTLQIRFEIHDKNVVYCDYKKIFHLVDAIVSSELWKIIKGCIGNIPLLLDVLPTHDWMNERINNRNISYSEQRLNLVTYV